MPRRSEKLIETFFFNILSILLFYSLVYFCYLILGERKEPFVGFLLIMSVCSAFFFYVAKNEISRFQSVFSLCLSFFCVMLILEQEWLFYFLLFFLSVVNFFFVFYKRIPLNFCFFAVIFGYLLICSEIRFWVFALLAHLVYFFLIIFIFKLLYHESYSAPSNSIFFFLLCILISLLFIEDFDCTSPLKNLFLFSGSLVCFGCFLSKNKFDLFFILF